MKPDEPGRPDPEALLEEVGRQARGQLKVFLGMAPGVGKTYEMLREARSRKAGGGEVLVGVVETHGRRETEALLRGLEVLPRKPLDYRDRTFLEFDLDEALRRKPALLLVDEYAHSNIPGSRHPKRWQDVEELLSAGIDVWTTLNVQHLESLVDVVWKITGVRQRETVPDSALSRADEIELVDITPSELRQRMADGKVYLEETARVAADRFFKPENLTALRELALRRAAETVDDQLLGAMKRAGVEGPWAAGERILVLIGGAPVAAALVRAGRRISDMMANAPWTVAHVDQPNRPPPDAASAHRPERGVEAGAAARRINFGSDRRRHCRDRARLRAAQQRHPDRHRAHAATPLPRPVRPLPAAGPAGTLLRRGAAHRDRDRGRRAPDPQHPKAAGPASVARLSGGGGLRRSRRRASRRSSTRCRTRPPTWP